MPLCGFNDKMLEGMDSFHKGLMEAILDKMPADRIVEEEPMREVLI